MARSLLLARLAVGVVLVAALYLGPALAGMATANSRLAPCLRGADAPTAVTVKLGFTPGPDQIETLQRYGLYSGSGTNVQHVVLENVSRRNVRLLSRLYWISRIEPVDGC